MPSNPQLTLETAHNLQQYQYHITEPKKMANEKLTKNDENFAHKDESPR